MAEDSNKFDSLAWIHAALADLELSKRRRFLGCRESPPISGQTQFEGRTFVNFSSNDYLGIAAAGELVDAVRHAASQFGWGSGASPLVTGRGILHRRLEHELATFKRTPSALLFPTGYAANVGVITSLVGPGDAVFSDANNHASIIDGCRLSGASVHVYRHGNASSLEQLLADETGARRRLIVTDSLFSMDGDFVPLTDLVRLAGQFGAMLMVDEAHATGVWGTQGRGICEMQQVEHAVPIRVGTLSKALGSIGGFVAGSQSLIDWIANRARTYMFSTAQPEAISAAALAGLEIVKSQPERRERLQTVSRYVKSVLVEQGWNCGNTSSQIIPVLIGDEGTALEINGRLRAMGVLVPAIRPPAVLDGQCLLRISLSSGHSDQQLEQLLSAFAQLRKP